MTGPKSIFEQQQSMMVKKDGSNYEMAEQDQSKPMIQNSPMIQDFNDL